MSLSFNNATEVFIFIILCSIYVCSILWIYGDSTTRGMGIKGAILPLIFVIAASLTLTLGMSWTLIVWPIGYAAWFFLRPSKSQVITE
jgi:hypothetical protein